MHYKICTLGFPYAHLVGSYFFNLELYSHSGIKIWKSQEQSMDCYISQIIFSLSSTAYQSMRCVTHDIFEHYQFAVQLADEYT